MEFNPSKTAAYLAGKIDEYVKFQGRDTIKRNAARDRNCRYARIPDGRACDFCKMLGSRGFVYHSEFKAGGDGHDYHPYCNCQIAVCFDPFVEKYDVVSESGTIVTVTRGYGDGELVQPGRDGSYELREADIDGLYDEYRAMGRKFNAKSKYKDYTKGAKLSDEEFEAAMRRLSEARTLDELHEAGKDIVDNWPKNDNGRDKHQWDEMSKFAKNREKELGLNPAMAVDVDRLVPCLIRLEDEEIVQTTVKRVQADDLGSFKKSSGWFINWADVPSDAEIYQVFVEGSDVVEGMIAFRDDPANFAVRGLWAVAAPHNQASRVGKANKKYDGVGGHLFAIAAKRSVELGYNGFIHGKADTSRVLQHYMKEFGATPTGFEEGLGFFIDEAEAHKLLRKYTWTAES